MKFIGKIGLLVFIFCVKINAQTYAKLNVLPIPVGMFNSALEAKISTKNTLQAEVFISPWRSFFGNRFQIYDFNLEGRHYFKESFKKYYIGANIGLAFFDIQKWNYLNTTKYQRGYTVLYGATVGYQFQYRENWNVDLFLGIANSQGFYHGYNEIDGQRYEKATVWNKSGEWIPYKAGIMIAYKLK